jgi:perosamine synthetase
LEIPLFKIHWNEKDIKLVEKVIRSGKSWCIGAEIEEFEEKIANYLGLSHCVLLNSGGSALLALMESYGFSKGDEIIVPSFTFIGTAYAPLYVGARPVFADIEEITFGLNVENVKRKITPKTKAIIPIHYGGMSCKIKELEEVATDHNLILIEDAAESFGAKLKEKLTGTFGDSAIFSFCQNKVFTTSEGGAVVTNDSDLAEKVRLFRSYGRVMSGDYFSSSGDIDYVEAGYNLRMSSILAALGISQLNRVNDLITLRRKNAQYLNNRLSEVEGLILPTPPSNEFFCVYQMYTIRVKEGRKKRDELMRYLLDKGITSKVYFDPVHRYSLFQKLGYSDEKLPITERLSSEVLTLPMYPHMTNEELEYISEAVIGFF